MKLNRNRSIVIAAFVILAVVTVSTMFMGTPPTGEMCIAGEKFPDKNVCYCPEDRITPLGNPEAQWIETGDGQWECVFLT